KRWLAPQCGLPAPPRNFSDNSEFTGNFQKLWLSATSETQIQRKRGALDQTSLISKTRDYLGAAGKSAPITRGRSDVRFSYESGHLRCKTACPLWAKSGHDLKKMELGKSAFL